MPTLEKQRYRKTSQKVPEIKRTPQKGPQNRVKLLKRAHNNSWPFLQWFVICRCTGFSRVGTQEKVNSFHLNIWRNIYKIGDDIKSVDSLYTTLDESYTTSWFVLTVANPLRPARGNSYSFCCLQWPWIYLATKQRCHAQEGPPLSPTLQCKGSQLPAGRAFSGKPQSQQQSTSSFTTGALECLSFKWLTQNL